MSQFGLVSNLFREQKSWIKSETKQHNNNNDVIKLSGDYNVRYGRQTNQFLAENWFEWRETIQKIWTNHHLCKISFCALVVHRVWFAMKFIYIYWFDSSDIFIFTDNAYTDANPMNDVRYKLCLCCCVCMCGHWCADSR